MNTGPTDLGLDDIGPDTPKTPGVGLGGLGGLSQSGSERHIGGVSRGGMSRSASKSQLKRANISSASLAAMDSLRAEPDIWQVCPNDVLLNAHSVTWR